MKNIEKYKLGVIVGRFNHMHNGHELLINKGLEMCEKVLILIGSSIEKQTLRNPFSFKTRLKTIQNVYSNITDTEIIIKGIPDLTNEYDYTIKWGEFILENVFQHTEQYPDVLIYGDDKQIQKCFSKKNIENMSSIVIKRNINPISGTQLRGLLLIGEYETWKNYVHPNNYYMYEKLRKELLVTKEYEQIYNILKNIGMTFENYMNIYQQFVKEDEIKKIKELKIKG